MRRNLQHLLSASALALFVFIAFGSVGDDDSSENTTGNSSSISTDNDESQEPNKPKENWVYQEGEDKMEGTKRYFATSTSTNELNFEFPYNGGSTAQFMVRNMGSKNEILMTISKGQFMGSFSGSETVRMKFDDGEPFNVSFNSADDGSSDVIFFNSTKKIMSKLKTAEKLMVEAPFYDAGRQILYFDVKGLNWER